MDQQKIQEDAAIPLNFNTQNQSQLNLVCTINSKEPYTDPDSIQADFITIKGESVVALKVIRTFVFIRLQGTKAQQDQQYQEQPNQVLSCFKLIDSDHLVGGFYEGRVILKQISTQKILKDFNRQGNECLIKKRPIKIHITQKYFITLFLEGILAVYNLDYNLIKNDYDKFIKLSFQQHNKIVNPKILKQFKPDNNFTYNFLNYGEFTNFQYVLDQNNPHILFRFESLALNDAEILPLNPLEHLKKSEHVIEQALIIAFSGLDGYFRILEARKNKPLFSFKTEYAGICSFSFNPNFSSVCLGAQDDSAYIINFNQKISWIRLIGHNSFISRGVFSSLSASEFKIVCGCYDGSLSITDIDLNTFNTEESMFIKAKDIQTINVKNMQSVSQDGVANVAEYQNYIVCMNFDGTIKIFLIS